MRGRCLTRLLAAIVALAALPARADPPGRSVPAPPPVTVGRICDLISLHATTQGLPREFFARLIWKESRFDPSAVSPAGAEGIAQFMPGTARMRGLADSFDIEQAIPASAAYLAEMKTSFGNLGLAAAAYNAGEGRVSRWLASGGFLPMETENYILDIFGEPADNFSNRAHAATIHPLDPKLEFHDACRAMRVVMRTTIPMSSITTKRWGIQVAGNFRRDAAIRQYQRVKGRYPTLLGDLEPVVSRVRSPLGRRGIYAVRIGADERAEANAICRKLKEIGGSCVVMRNR